MVEQIFEFNQSDYIPEANDGICINLCMEWISMMSSDKSSAPARKQRLSMTKGNQLMQSKYDNYFSALGSRQEDFVYNLHGFSRDSYQVLADFPLQTIYDFVTGRRRAGTMFGIYFKGGGHQLAFWRSGVDTWHASGHVYAFDPNEGEYKMNKGDLQHWLDTFIRDNYGALRKVDLAYAVKREGPIFGAKGGGSHRG